ncbi:21 kDa protein-like [Lycium ferocissimum]|uniref:21 kDa protein-like n=1 Tax=Lycium ferocissimum TaxID=112874 RepID=UPI00281572CC|nr:21 kDa protein-like [Lycium ferocissimum]
MEKVSIFLLLLILSIVAAVDSSTTGRLRPHPSFVETQCRRTRYPEPCVTFLSNYVKPTSQDPQEIVHAALKVSLVRAIHTRTYIRKICKEHKQMTARDYQAIKECLDQISDGVSQLTNSVIELQNLNLNGQEDFVWHQSNVQTWLSTVLTDAYTCLNGINPGHGKVKATIKAKVLNVAQVTSNALALFNGFATRYKASHQG